MNTYELYGGPEWGCSPSYYQADLSNLKPLILKAYRLLEENPEFHQVIASPDIADNGFVELQDDGSYVIVDDESIYDCKWLSPELCVRTYDVVLKFPSKYTDDNLWMTVPEEIYS